MVFQQSVKKMADGVLLHFPLNGILSNFSGPLRSHGELTENPTFQEVRWSMR